MVRKLLRGAFNVKFADRHGCRGNSKAKCTRLYFVCFSQSACLAESTMGQCLGTTSYGGRGGAWACQCMCVCMSLWKHLRGRVSTVEEFGLA